MPEATQLDRGHRKERQGKVISNKMAKTIVVKVTRMFEHRKYKRVIRKFTKFYAHDESGQARAGDTVRIPPNVPHFVDVIEDCVVFDLFSPRREDWIRGDDAYLRAK